MLIHCGRFCLRYLFGNDRAVDFGNGKEPNLLEINQDGPKLLFVFHLRKDGGNGDGAWRDSVFSPHRILPRFAGYHCCRRVPGAVVGVPTSIRSEDGGIPEFCLAIPKLILAKSPKAETNHLNRLSRGLGIHV